jgi:hypothetical protein
MADYDNKSLNKKIRTDNNFINLLQITKLETEIKTTSLNKSSKIRSKSADIYRNKISSNRIRLFTSRNSSRGTRIYSVDLKREIEDPANDGVRDEIERIIHFYRQIEQLKNDFNIIEK